MSEIKWNEFLIPYSQAVDELKIKFRNLRKEFLEKINLPINLLRISVGVENIDEIKKEFEKLNTI